MTMSLFIFAIQAKARHAGISPIVKLYRTFAIFQTCVTSLRILLHQCTNNCKRLAEELVQELDSVTSAIGIGRIYKCLHARSLVCISHGSFNKCVI